MFVEQTAWQSSYCGCSNFQVTVYAVCTSVQVAEGLPKEERSWLSDRLQSVQQFSEEVQLQVVMGLLRGVFERLQKDHVHSDGEKVGTVTQLTRTQSHCTVVSVSV